MVGFIHLSTVHHHIDRWPAMYSEGALRSMPSPATQENILAESVGMIPDTRQRLSQALEQLQSALVGGWVLRPLPSCGLIWGDGTRPPHHSDPSTP